MPSHPPITHDVLSKFTSHTNSENYTREFTLKS